MLFMMYRTFEIVFCGWFTVQNIKIGLVPLATRLATANYTSARNVSHLPTETGRWQEDFRTLTMTVAERDNVFVNMMACVVVMLWLYTVCLTVPYTSSNVIAPHGPSKPSSPRPIPPQFPGTCSSPLLVSGCSNVAC